MVWVLIFLLVFSIIFMVSYIFIRKTIPYVTEHIEKNETDREITWIEREINFKQHKRNALQKITGYESEVAQLDNDIEELEKLHDDIRRGED